MFLLSFVSKCPLPIAGSIVSAFGVKVSNKSVEPVSIKLIEFGLAEATIEAVGHKA